MGWETPRTWTTNEVVTAAQLNEQIRDNETYLYDQFNASTGHDHDGTDSKVIRIPCTIQFAMPGTTSEFLGADVTPPYFVNIDYGALTIVDAKTALNTAPGAGYEVTIDIHKEGTTIFTTQANRPSIIGTDTEALGVPDVTTLADDDKISLDIDVATGSATDLSVMVRCYWKPT